MIAVAASPQILKSASRLLFRHLQPSIDSSRRFLLPFFTGCGRTALARNGIFAQQRLQAFHEFQEALSCMHACVRAS